MSKTKVPDAFKKKIVSFSIKPSVLLEFKANCFKEGKRPSHVVQELLIGYNDEVLVNSD